jgi:DNA polymerase III delta prime subunit
MHRLRSRRVFLNNMKIPFFSKIALLGFAIGVASLTAASAQDANTDTSTEHQWHHDSVLTADEQAELKKDREQVFTVNPDLKTEGKDLWEQRKTMKDASDEDKQAFREKMHAYKAKLDAAIEGVDSNAAALIAKLDAAHHHHHDAGSDSSSSNQ